MHRAIGGPMILAADIGGTKTDIALLEAPTTAVDAERPVRFVAKAQYLSGQHSGLGAIAADFLQRQGGRRVRRLCAGIAGPVVDGRVETPNLPWSVSARELERQLGVERVTLLNDLEATAERAATLTADDVHVLNVGAPPSGVLTGGAVLAAGTGLGMAILQPVGGAWWPVASEGGHMDFAPRDELEMALLRFLLRRHKRVSTERVLSGPGLVSLFEFFVDQGEAPDRELAEQVAADREQGPRAVAEAALAGRCAAAHRALDRFVSLYGAAAGNLALLAVATSGVFIAGGIAPKILERLKGPSFMQAFLDKGRLSSLLEKVPVKIVLDREAGLNGAARRAVRLDLGLVSEG
jgi:glucokinase